MIRFSASPRGQSTTLHHLAAAGIDEDGRLARAKLLLNAGASLGERESLLKSTPLGWACRWGRIALVQLYLERGTDALELDAEPWAMPLAWAIKGGHRDLIELLHSHGAE
ncbi:MAG: ankyrin repeat domain-containing protein [Planctomycetota bacterium]|nr:ankyrin repeat domain-containing protein [Planctomycetota bacterium]